MLETVSVWVIMAITIFDPDGGADVRSMLPASFWQTQAECERRLVLEISENYVASIRYGRLAVIHDGTYIDSYLSCVELSFSREALKEMVGERER